MKLYAVETILDEPITVGIATSREIAQKKADEYAKHAKKNGLYREYYITTYTMDKNGYIEFNND